MCKFLSVVAGVKILLLETFVLLCGSTSVSAQIGIAAQSPHPDPRFVVPYCGIHSLYAAALAEGVNLPFEKLVLGKYVGCSLGSTLAELENAATDNGLYALPVANLEAETLARSSHPVLLHVKSIISADRYDHYVVFLGMRQDKAMVLDAGYPIAFVSASDLSSKWDGTGLIVSAKPITTAGIFGAARLGFLLLALLLADGILIAKRFNLMDANDRVGVGRLSQRSVGILAASAIVAFIYNLSSPTGLLASGGSTEELDGANIGNSLVTLSLAQVQKLKHDGQAAFVDARHADDYSAGHLEGALSVPVDATDAQRHSTMAGIPKSTPIVIYCQSEDCPYSAEIAHALYADGYEHLAIYKGGWEDWDATAKGH